MSSPIILCGYGRVGRRVLASLRSIGAEVVIIDQSAPPHESEYAGSTYVRGDCREPEVLKQAGIETCSGIVIVTSDDLVNVSTALVARTWNADARIVVRMFNQNLLNRLSGAVKNTVALSVSALTAPYIALTAMAGTTFAAVKFGETPMQIVESVLTTESAWIGSTIEAMERASGLIVSGTVARMLQYFTASILACSSPPGKR